MICENWGIFNREDSSTQYCAGTKEWKFCSCDGDVNKCDFCKKNKKEEIKKMNTAEMISESLRNSDAIYCSVSKFSGGIWYNNKKGFCYNDGVIIKHVDYLDEIMNLDDWFEYKIPVMTKSEAEAKFNIKIVG